MIAQSKQPGIDPFDGEELIPLADVPKLLPKRGNKRICVSAVYRWSSDGLRGVKLSTVQLAGRKMTTRSALRRFFDELGGASDAASSPQPGPRTPGQRARSKQRAMEELEAARI